jgi:hypothetical protein
MRSKRTKDNAVAKPAKIVPSTGAVLDAVGTPKMHTGGPVMADGTYQLKAGEHVLTAPEAAKARKHAIMASGIKSLAKAGKGKH